MNDKFLSETLLHQLDDIIITFDQSNNLTYLNRDSEFKAELIKNTDLINHLEIASHHQKFIKEVQVGHTWKWLSWKGFQMNGIKVFVGKDISILKNAQLEFRNYMHLISKNFTERMRKSLAIVQLLTIESKKNSIMMNLADLEYLSGQLNSINGLLSKSMEVAKSMEGDVNIQKISLREISDKVINELRKPSKFSITCPNEDLIIWTDLMKVYRIFYALIENAIIHNDKVFGNLEIRWSKFNNEVQISFQDDGPGINPKYYHKVFNAFETLSNNGADFSGLGLTMVRNYINTLNGEVFLYTNDKGGVTVILDFQESYFRPD